MLRIDIRNTPRYAETMSNKRNTAVVTISLSPERLAKLDRLAAEAGRSRSNTIARWIDGAKDSK